jgi:NADH pyrophosphatase NudC (nudix superfamily)
MPDADPQRARGATMGFFDTVKAKAGDLAADAERAGRVTAVQTKIAVLQQDLKKAERELGHSTFALAARGEFDHPELAAAIERVRAAQGAIDAKEAEVAGLRTAGDAPAQAAACASCGAVLEREARFCAECGAGVAGPAPAADPPSAVEPPTAQAAAPVAPTPEERAGT